MADAFNNPTSHADIIPEIWASTAILAADDHTANAFIGLSTNDSRKLANGGDIIHYPIQSDVNLTDVSQTAEMDAVQFSMTIVNLTIDTHKGNPILVTTQLDGLANQDPMDNLARQAGFAAGREVDTALAGLFASAGETVTGNTSLDITEAQIREAKRKLDIANAPRVGRWLVVSPTQSDALSAIAAFRTEDSIANGQDAVTEGRIGRVHGFDVFMGSNVVEVTSAGLVHNMAGVANADPMMSSLVHAFGNLKPTRAGNPTQTVPAIGLKTTFAFDPKRFGDIMAVETLFGVQAVRSEWLVDIQTQDTL